MIILHLLGALVLFIVFTLLMFKTSNPAALRTVYKVIRRLDIQLGIFAGLYLLITTLIVLVF